MNDVLPASWLYGKQVPLGAEPKDPEPTDSQESVARKGQSGLGRGDSAAFFIFDRLDPNMSGGVGSSVGVWVTEAAMRYEFRSGAVNGFTTTSIAFHWP